MRAKGAAAKHRAKIAEALRGRSPKLKRNSLPPSPSNRSPEMRAKFRAARLGRPPADETRAKISAAKFGERMSPEAVARSVATKRANRAAKLLGS